MMVVGGSSNTYCLKDYYDVWGNAEDGWQVNDLCTAKSCIEISDTATDKDILDYLCDIGFLETNDPDLITLQCYGENIEIVETETDKPLGRLELVTEV